jgi:pilus assembly protein Flp/PilA
MGTENIPPPELTNLEELMRSLAKKVQHFLVSEDGPTAVEYAVMLALIIIVCLAAIGALGEATNAQFEAITAEIGEVEAEA